MERKNCVLYILLLLGFAVLSGCDDDSFSTSQANMLTFTADTVSLDTMFSTVPSSTRSFWVYNKSGDGIRCTSVRLERGNQSGFRVNVDGQYLGQSEGYNVGGIEMRNKDSIRVFVEITMPRNNRDKPVEVLDNLVFTLESGRQQKVCLKASSWDADILRQCKITDDYTIDATERPLVVYGGIEVAAGATLTIKPGSTIYFHSGGGLDVHGRLVCEGTAGKGITLRGDRLDRMFDYLPYDRVSGQWDGVRFYEESYDNVVAYTDIHSTFDGVRVDSSDVDRQTLTLQNSIIHNCQGYGLVMEASKVSVENCQITNTLNDCVYADGGDVSINSSTLAQFYPFDAKRGYAIRFSAVKNPLVRLQCLNSIITGYADDVLQRDYDKDGTNAESYFFGHCVIRTPEVGEEYADKFVSVVFEDVEDTTRFGMKHFALVDGDEQRYDFRLTEKSAAIGVADPETATSSDRDGKRRKEKPDAGAYEFTDDDNDNQK